MPGSNSSAGLSASPASPGSPGSSGSSAAAAGLAESPRRAARRCRILGAARTVFAEHGFERATIREIAARADVSDGTIYNYFADKQALLDALFDDLVAVLAAPARLGAVAGAPAAIVEAYCRYRLELFGGQQANLRALLPEIIADPRLQARYRRAVLGPELAAGERVLARRDDAPSHDARAGSRFVAAAILGLSLLDALEDPDDTPSGGALGERAPQWIARCLCPPESP